MTTNQGKNREKEHQQVRTEPEERGELAAVEPGTGAVLPNCPGQPPMAHTDEKPALSRRRLLQSIGTAGIAAACGAGVGTLSANWGMPSAQAAGGDEESGCGPSGLYIKQLAERTCVHGSTLQLAGYHEGGRVGGGLFVYDETVSRSLHNGGSVIAPGAPYPADWSIQAARQAWYGYSGADSGCWMRCRESGETAFAADDFGAKPYEPAAVDTEAVQACIDAADPDATIRLGDGTYRMNIRLAGSLVGNGYSTIITPAVASQPGIVLARRIPTGDWRWRKVEDFSYNGVTRGAAAITYPEPADSPTDGRFVGRYAFARILFSNCLAAVRKPQGNIGNVFRELTVMASDYGVWSTSVNTDPSMHEGNDHYIRCHMGPNIAKACYRYDRSTRSGSSLDLVFDGCIHEYVSGFGLLVTGGAANGISTGSIDFRGGWFERVAGTGDPVAIDSTMRVPYEISLTHVRNASLSGLLMESIELVNASLHMRDSQLSDITGTARLRVAVDADSALTSEGDRSQYGRPQNMLVTSIGAPHVTSRGGAWTPLRAKATHQAFGSDAQYRSFAGAAAIPSVSHPSIVSAQVNDGVLNATCAEYAIPASATVTLTTPWTLTPGRYVVASVHLRNMSGDVRTAFRHAGGILLTNDFLANTAAGWRCISTLAQVRAQGDNRVALTLLGATAGSVVRVADWQIVQFDRLADAQAYHNGLACLTDN